MGVIINPFSRHGNLGKKKHADLFDVEVAKLGCEPQPWGSRVHASEHHTL